MLNLLLVLEKDVQPLEKGAKPPQLPANPAFNLSKNGACLKDTPSPRSVVKLGLLFSSGLLGGFFCGLIFAIYLGKASRK